MAVSSSGVPFVDDSTHARQFLLERTLEDIDKAKAEGKTVCKVPWWRGAAWQEMSEGSRRTPKFSPESIRGIDIEVFKQDISRESGYGCFDGHSGLEVKLQTPDEQKAAATERVAKWIKSAIRNIDDLKWKEPYDGLTADDYKMLKRWYPAAFSPTGDLLVRPDDVETQVRNARPKWYISDRTTFAVRKR